MIPNPKNFCGGNFQDWIEVMLTPYCNGSCKWCIEKNGYHPKKMLHYDELAAKINETNKQNILLLGGEPTLYPNLGQLLEILVNRYNRNVYITSNGYKINQSFIIEQKLNLLSGINLSIHHYNLEENYNITGVRLNQRNLIDSLRMLGLTTKIRFNCNLILGEIDNVVQINAYINFAKTLGAHSVRFAELKNDVGNFVDLCELYPYESNNIRTHGINDDPFTFGCNHDTVINGMHVNFRQMCGLQTSKRPMPQDPVQEVKHVIYYNGIVYDGWQVYAPKQPQQEDNNMKSDNELILEALLNNVKNGGITVDGAMNRIMKMISKSKTTNTPTSRPMFHGEDEHRSGGGGCVY